MRTQENENLSKLVEALKENNKSLREFLQQGNLNAKQLQDNIGLLINSMRNSSDLLHNDLKEFMKEIESSVKMRTTIESDKAEITQKMITDNEPTEADKIY